MTNKVEFYRETVITIILESSTSAESAVSGLEGPTLGNEGSSAVILVSDQATFKTQSPGLIQELIQEYEITRGIKLSKSIINKVLEELKVSFSILNFDKLLLFLG